MNNTRVVVFAAAAALMACGGGGIESDLEGIYTIDTWTESDTGCDAEGPSILENQFETSLYLEIQSFLGVKALVLATCADTASCAAEAAEDTFELFSPIFDQGDDEDGWLGESYILTSSGEGPCSGQVIEYSLTSDGPGMPIRAEIRGKNVDNVPRDADDFCDGDAAVEQAESLPCSTLEVITASFVQGL